MHITGPIAAGHRVKQVFTFKNTNAQCVFTGPIAAVRVARVRDGRGSRMVVNPSGEHLEAADMSVLYAGTEQRCTLFELQVGTPKSCS